MKTFSSSFIFERVRSREILNSNKNASRSRAARRLTVCDWHERGLGNQWSLHFARRVCETPNKLELMPALIADGDCYCWT